MGGPEASTVPTLRIREANGRSARTDGDYVLYWMIAFRRVGHNFALDRAAEWARHLGVPLVVLEALSVDYRYASNRLHAFVVEGMAANRAALEDSGAVPYHYLEPRPGAGRGLVDTLASRAAVVVTDDAPIHELPKMVDRFADRTPIRVEAVDSNGLLPMRAADKVFARAYDFRRHLQKNLLDHLDEVPGADPLRDLPSAPTGLIADVVDRWPEPDVLDRSAVGALPVDHTVGVLDRRGGGPAARQALDRFIGERLHRYEDRNQPDSEATSELSPYLHFGHIAAHEVFARVVESEGWSPDRVADSAKGSRSGWWGMSAAAEGFLDQLVTWRELGLNMAWQVPECDTYETLPEWARTTLEAHAGDPRPALYSFDEMAGAGTEDPIWNAAQRQLLREGVIHNYLRMLWGKKILEWTGTPRQALEVMLELNNRWAVDGRDPNSTSGIFWVMGRYDRPWPEREVFGQVRYMSSDSTRRKLRLRGYLDRYGPDDGRLPLG